MPLASKTSVIELLVRERLRNLDDRAPGLKTSSRICIAGHIISLAGLFPVLMLELSGVFRAGGLSNTGVAVLGILSIIAIGIAAIATIISAVFNRLSMYCALRMLADIEAAIAISRSRQARGGIGNFLDLVPFSILIPPGDLISVAPFLVLIRSNTDHLAQQQGVDFQKSELAFGIGATLQYAAFLLLVYACPFSGSSNVLTFGLGLAWHAITLIGVICVEWSSQTMHKEIAEFVIQVCRHQAPQSPSPLNDLNESI